MPADPAPTHSLKELNALLAADIETVCRHYLPNGKRNGNYWQVGSTAGEEGASLRIDLAGRWRGYWRDWANPKDRGSPLDLIRAVRNHASIGEAAAEARRYLALPAYEPPRCGPRRPDGAPEAQKGLERVLDGAAPIGPDDPAGRYLASRGLALDDARAAGLRFRPDTWVQVDGEKCELPALLAPIRALDGTLEGLQRIFLAPDGRKAPIPDPKRTSGRLFSGAVRWPAPGATRMVLTEGIEDALAVMRALGASGAHGIAVAAAISAGRVHRVGLSPDIRRATLVQDRDMAGEQAWVALCREHGGSALLLDRIVPRAKDANDELLALGPAGFRARLAAQGLSG
ncbi:MAG: toprim domain-containing protein [Alphaproteobacteria bacterium]|nr:toprim domain-containing protein [Alphaproteobacteria bacterium]